MEVKVLQFPPEGSSRVVRMRTVPKQWSTSAGYAPAMGFFESWMERDTVPDSFEAPTLNWAAIYGLAISVAISASFWIGAVLLVERLLK